ncbi:MAG: dihydrofolate reductase [Treponema sp.]|jgi:dihydrofolate reductase|nr:dihydrofolate reductase [Treponema sp.]
MGKPLVIIIAAVAENRVIGRGGAIPWSIREDMRRFRDLTMGFPCVMGRRTWESLPRKPLPGRPNIVVSKLMAARRAGSPGDRSAGGESTDGALIFPSLDEALKHCGAYEKVFICGGASLYREAMPAADIMEITMIHESFKGDVFFPEIDPRVWVESAVVRNEGFSFISFSRKK